MTWAFEQFHLIGLAENSKRQYTKVVSDRVGTNRQKNKRPWAVIVLLCSCRAKQLVLHIRKKSIVWSTGSSMYHWSGNQQRIVVMMGQKSYLVFLSLHQIGTKNQRPNVGRSLLLMLQFQKWRDQAESGFFGDKQCQPIPIWTLNLAHTAIPYRASTGPEQGFPCVLFPHREKPFPSISYYFHIPIFFYFLEFHCPTWKK
jgi:hypothetical protein